MSIYKKVLAAKFDFNPWVRNLGIEHVKLLKDDHDENGNWNSNISTPKEPYKVPSNPKHHLKMAQESKKLMEIHEKEARKAKEALEFHQRKAKEFKTAFNKHEANFKKAMENK